MAEIRSAEYWSLNMWSCNYIVYGRDHNLDSVIWKMCAVLAPRWQYNPHWIVDISPIASQIRSVAYGCLNMRSCNYIVHVRDNSSDCVSLWLCAVLAPRWQYNPHWIVDISPIASQIRSVEYWILNMRSCKCIVYVRHHSSHCVNWRLCAVLATRLQYNALCIVDISPKAAKLRSVEYWSLNMWSCNYSVYGRDHHSDSVICRMCAELGTKFAV
jgi:hypothetical protein